MDDKQLVRSCLQGDVDEFRKIVDKYRGRIMALALNILGNHQDAEDACQETFIQVYRNLDGFDFQKSFSNWLYTILYNRCLDQIRKRSRFYKFYNKMKRESFQSSAAQVSNIASHQPLPQRILKELTPKERTLLTLWANEGYTSEEMAGVMKCSPSTARVHLFRARKKIKALLEKENASMQTN